MDLPLTRTGHTPDLIRDSEIMGIKAFPIGFDVPSGHGFGSTREIGRRRSATLLQVMTRCGAVGWGECYGPPATTMAYLPMLEDAYVGCPIIEHPTLWRRLSHTFYHVRGHSQLGAAMAGLDIALNDAWGQILGLPLYRLFGGIERMSVPVYASGGFFGETHAASLSAQLERVAGQFNAFKIKIGRGVSDDVTRARTARQIIGDEPRLMLDMNGAYRVDEAIESMEKLSAFNPWWIEEPLAPEDIPGYRRLALKTCPRIAAGETAITATEMRSLAETGAIDVLMPDLHLCGGFLEGFAIAGMVRLSGLRVSPHVWGGAIAQAAAAHFAAAIPPEPHPQLSEVPVEWDVSDNPMRDELLIEPLSVENGHMKLPSGPGLGIEVDLNALKRLTLD